MSEFISYIFTMLVIAPLQAEIGKHIDAKQSAELTSAVSSCVSTAVPNMVSQAQSDWGWAFWTAVNVSVGAKQAESLLEGRGPACDRVTALLSNTSSDELKGDGEA